MSQDLLPIEFDRDTAVQEFSKRACDVPNEIRLHGVGIKLGPYMRRQHGPALDALRGIKAALDPDNIMNPGKMGL